MAVIWLVSKIVSAVRLLAGAAPSDHVVWIICHWKNPFGDPRVLRLDRNLFRTWPITPSRLFATGTKRRPEDEVWHVVDFMSAGAA